MSSRLVLLMMMGTVLLPSCTKVRFLAQAAHGQLDLRTRAVPIKELLRDPNRVPKKLRDLLSEVQRMKAFAVERGLVDSGNYQSFAQLDRDAAVYVVTASPPLTFEEKTWWFPLFGSFPYLGWFDRQDAEAFAQDVAQDGYDVDVRGASAYSTLGWFEDAVLSSMIYESQHPQARLAEIIFHETAHATVFVDDQAYYNEGLASFIGNQLVEEYLATFEGENSLSYTTYTKLHAEEQRKVARMNKAFEQLSKLYASRLPGAKKLKRKAEILKQLEADVEAKRPINNATLMGLRYYRAASDHFARLFAACGKRWPPFVNALASITEDHFIEEQDANLSPVLRKLESACRPSKRRLR